MSYKDFNNDVKKAGTYIWWAIAIFFLIVIGFAMFVPDANAHRDTSTHCISVCNPGSNICTLQCY